LYACRTPTLFIFKYNLFVGVLQIRLHKNLVHFLIIFC